MAPSRPPTSPLWRRVDGAVVFVIIVLVLAGTSRSGVEPGERPADWLAYVCGLVAAGSLWWWRRWTPVVAGVVSVAIAVFLLREYPPGPTLLPGPLAMLALGFTAPRRMAWMVAGGSLALLTVVSVIAGEDLFFHLLLFFGWATAGVLAGQTLAAGGERAAAESERVAHVHEQALASERLRIAQDLHDSVAHGMATINVQSGVAAHLVETKPEQAGVALEAIRAASRDVLDELGAILGVLRESDSAAPLSPQGGIEAIKGLIERARSDGLTVAFTQTGDIASVSKPVGATGYRAVQEALTNTRRHAGPAASATVSVAAGDRGSLEVTVSDDGGDTAASRPDTPERSSELGLVGMRERVEATGGSLRVGPLPSGGFLVEASWPERSQP